MEEQLRVLLVEDSEDDALLLVLELRKGGYVPCICRVQDAETLDSALREQTWDVLITDHSLPGFGSQEVLQRIKAHDLDIPTIIVSGSIGEDIAVAAMKDGAHDYLMKNNLARLVPAIQRELREVERRRTHRQAEATIRHLAFHDALTGLVNRHEFDRRLKAALQTAKDEDKHHVLLYLDLDQFKVINDSCGHQAGDQLLSQLAVVLRDKIRARDTLARLGGDEFGLLLENCPLGQAEEVAEQLRETVRGFRFVWRDRSFSVGVSIGMVPITADALSVDEVLGAADVACYTAKDLGRDRVHVYIQGDAELARRHDEMRWVGRIKEAMDEGRFFLHRQCIQALNHEPEPLQYSEFLLRMRDEDGRTILPGTFIPAAERYGIMLQLDRWVVKAVMDCLTNEACRESGVVESGLFFVNLSGASLSDEAFFAFIAEQLQRTGLAPERLCFEITETAAVANLYAAVTFIKSIRGLGCSFALDDFGAGLSSFSYLKSIPVDFLKIDGGFVRELVDDPMNHAIVRAVNEIGHVAGLRTIAEFVESDAVLDSLREIGVDFAQGYAIGRPARVMPGLLSLH